MRSTAFGWALEIQRGHLRGTMLAWRVATQVIGSTPVELNYI